MNHVRARARLAGHVAPPVLAPPSLTRHGRPSFTSPVATVVLFGEPRHALQHYASSNGYEVIVTGSHTFGRSWLGTAPVTRVTGTGHSVPVLVGPGRP